VQLVVPEPVNVVLPHVRELIEGARFEPDPLRLIEVVFDTDPWVAVRVMVCEELTAAMVATKGALFAPEGTVTEPGTAIALLLLARLTASPVLGAAAVNVTVQLSMPAPAIEELEQLRLDREAVPELEPFPCSFMVLDDLVVTREVLIVVRLSVAVESVVVFGSYCTSTERLCEARRVAGNDIELTVNAPLELLRSVNCKDEVPEFVMEMFFETAVPTFTSPNSTAVGVTMSGAALVDENALESDPQPERPRLRLTQTSARAPDTTRPCRLSLLVISGRTADTSLTSNNEKLRILVIKRHLTKVVWCFGQPMRKWPAELAAGNMA
jgi:hypothetical protein